MPAILGLRGPYEKVGRLIYFGRMLDKIRLQAAGRLPPDYAANLGGDRPFLFDGRCCRFLGVAYESLRDRVLQGGSDGEILAWAEGVGVRRSDEDCVVWNRFMTKIGWRDDRTAILQQRILESGISGKPVETGFDVIDYDEGRDPAASRPWDAL